MRRKLLLIPILITLIFCLPTIGLGEAPPTATVAQEPVWTYEPASTEFTVNLTVADAEDIQGWDANITFDPTVLEVVDAAEGEFIKSGAPGGWTFFNYTAPEGKGHIYIGASYYMVAPPGWGVNGSGILANITFHVINAYDATPIHFQDMNLWYNNGTPPTKQQPRILHDGFFTILGDFNCNGDVDSSDLYLLARAYGTSVGNPNYNWLADLDSDDDVDSNDLNLYTENYGKSVGP
jgi:hypothetical protein